MSSKTHVLTRRSAFRAGSALAGLLAMAALTACSDSDGDTSEEDGSSDASGDSDADDDTSTSSYDAESEPIELIDTESLFSDRDLEGTWDEDGAIAVELSDAGTSTAGSGVDVDGSTITFTAEGVYLLTGSLSDGRLVVEAPDEKIQLVLSGASVTSSGPAALYVRDADKVFLTLATNTTNTFTATGASEEEDESTLDGAIFSKDDLTINGEGTLVVSSSQGHGIVGKDELTLVSGTLKVEATEHAIQANDSIAIAGGTYELTAGTDGIHAENEDDTELGYIYVGGGTFNIQASSDGIDAGYVLQIDDGTITVAAGDDGIHSEYDLAINGGTISVTSSVEAIEGSTISITGGSLDLVASDDGLNAAGEPNGSVDAIATRDNPTANETMEYDETAALLITGGTIVMDASGDGIDSNGDLMITGGETYVSGPTDGSNGALDYTGTGVIEGGLIVAAGSSGMAQNFGTDSTQASMLVSANGSSGDTIELADADGNVLASFTSAKGFGCVVISTPELEVGETYTLTVGSSQSEITLDDTIYTNVSGGFSGGTVLGNNGGGMGSGMNQIQQMTPNGGYGGGRAGR